MFPDVRFDITAAAPGSNDRMHIHIEAQFFRQEIQQDHVIHAFIMNTF